MRAQVSRRPRAGGATGRQGKQRGGAERGVDDRTGVFGESDGEAAETRQRSWGAAGRCRGTSSRNGDR